MTTILQALEEYADTHVKYRDRKLRIVNHKFVVWNDKGVQLYRGDDEDLAVAYLLYRVSPTDAF